MPNDMLKKLCASKYLFSASEMQLQLFYSVLDQYYHTQMPQSMSTTDLLSKLQVEYYGLPYVKNTVRYDNNTCPTLIYTFYLNSIGVAVTIFTFCQLWRKVLFIFGIQGVGSTHVARVSKQQSSEQSSGRTFAHRVFAIWRWEVCKKIGLRLPENASHT